MPSRWPTSKQASLRHRLCPPGTQHFPGSPRTPGPSRGPPAAHDLQGGGGHSVTVLPPRAPQSRPPRSWSHSLLPGAHCGKTRPRAPVPASCGCSYEQASMTSWKRCGCPVASSRRPVPWSGSSPRGPWCDPSRSSWLPWGGSPPLPSPPKLTSDLPILTCRRRERNCARHA